MSKNYSDHNLPQTNIKDYLPEVYRSDINDTVTQQAFDRFFTVDDTSGVSGFIGKGNPTAAIDRQIPETSTDSHDKAHRQGFQLAPTMYTKLGTEDFILSFRNFLTQLQLQGVDINRLPLWADALEFNFVPPVNIDMLVNYQDYFWSASSMTDLPQYLTIENKCNKSSDRLTAYAASMLQRGMHFPIVGVDFITNSFILSGKFDHMFTTAFIFNTVISNTINLSDKTWSVLSSSYNAIDDQTILIVEQPISISGVVTPAVPPTSGILGEWFFNTSSSTLYEWDSTNWIVSTALISAQIALSSLFPILDSSFVDNTFVVSGKQDDVFIPGFVFFTKDTTQFNMKNKFWTTVSSSFDADTYTTTVVVVEPIAVHSETPIIAPSVGEWYYAPSTDTLYEWNGTSWLPISKTIIADISLSELVAIFQTELQCVCSGSRGWDIGLWDDNSVGNVVWNTTLLAQISFATEGEWIVANTNPPNPLDLWYDTTLDALKQYGDAVHPLPSDPLFVPTWNTVVQNFSAILELTTAQENWDSTVGCNPQPTNQWVDQNSWKHKTSVESFASSKRAQLPIFEYDSNAELNKWTKVHRGWKYRKNNQDLFDASVLSPTRLELEPIKGYQVDTNGISYFMYLFDTDTIVNTSVNHTSVFVPGYKFRIIDDLGSSEIYTVQSSEFRDMTTSANPNLVGPYMATVVTLVDATFTSPIVGGLNNSRIIPITTSVGDLWLGYHVHWLLDVSSRSTSPIKPVPLNLFRGSGIVSEPVVGNIAYAGFTPQVGLITRGVNFQEMTIDIQDVSEFDLISSLQFSPTVVNSYATPDSNELRVYINGVRQYGNYTERLSTASPGYTEVGTTLFYSQQISYVNKITFDSSVVLQLGDVVRIEVGPASLYDMGLYSVPVRTVDDDDEFASMVTIGEQPVYQSLTSYELTEQIKSATNQYPLFNIYNLITGEVINASPILTFVENQSADVNKFIQRRLLISDEGVMIQQHLLDEDDNLLYGYRDTSTASAGQYWYSPLESKLQVWDGSSWSDQTVQNVGGVRIIIVPLLSATDPISLHQVPNALWLNTLTSKLYFRDVSLGTWVEEPNVVISDADPTMRTIWRKGSLNERSIPQYVDKNRNVVPTTTLDADWEVVGQWMFNPEHRNRSVFTIPQVVTHFRTIVLNQIPMPGLIGGGAYTKTQADYNYGVGGTIKEFNGAFDTLISSVNVTNTTPVGILEFAATEYAANIRFLRDIFNRQIIDLSINYQIDPTTTFASYIVDSLIASYENNDYVAQVYGDTSSYNKITGKGVRNWIATAPLFGLAPLYRPHRIVDDGLVQIYNHDGHRTNVSYSLAEEDTISRRVIAKIDPRTNTPFGGTSPSTPPSTVALFLTALGGSELRGGVFWYSTTNPHTFYRFELYAVSVLEPSIYLNGVEIPDGVYYYNTTTNNTFKKQASVWIAATTVGSYDISPMWVVVDFQQLLGDLYLEVENRLYEVGVGAVSVFDYSSLTPTAEETAVFQLNYKKRFDEYVSDFSVSTPYANIQYSQTDAFTWNYLTSVILTPPTTSVTPQPTSCWQLVYTGWYNTPYPHREPWKLQGFVDKPSWWDAEYLQTDGTRYWKYDHDFFAPGVGKGMWENIRIGMIPIGQSYPSGIISTGDSIADGQVIPTYEYFCVNISNSTIGGVYGSDQLLPPYFSTSDSLVRSIFSAISQINAPYADYTFGDGSVIEWQWKVSALYPYDIAVVAYIMQPVRFLRAAFGPKYMLVDGLEVDITFNQIYSHRDALFHGDVYNINSVYIANGLNQWYVNYNRFTGFDTSGEFRHRWVSWEPLLTYQSNGIIDTNSLEISHRQFDVIRPDYNVVLANNGAIKDIWVDAFNVAIINAPPPITRYNNQSKWKLEVTSLANTARGLQYYDVKSYPFSVDPNTNICHPYRYNISEVDASANRIYVLGNQIDIFLQDVSITITQSLNDGAYTVLSSVYEPSVDRTRINVLESVATITSGVINLTTFIVPWNTGDVVVLSSTNSLPAPLVPNTPYYIVNAANQNLQLAETFNDAISNLVIDILSTGVGVHTVSEISTSFQVMGGQSYSTELWYHYALDKSVVRTLSLPATISGMQTLINVIDGYAVYQEGVGVVQNTPDSNDFDFNTGRLINWGLECERFIDWAYGIRKSKMSVGDRYEYTANISTNTITFVDMIPTWVEGTAVQVSTSGTLPAPLDSLSTYYVVLRDEAGVSFPEGTIRLSISKDVGYSPFWVDISSQGSGRAYISIKGSTTSFPKFEINPTRNNIWLDTPLGSLSNILEGPYTDIRVKQTIFDQYGRAIGPNQLLVYRRDERSRVAIIPQIQNDVDIFLTNDPYNYIHLGGGHFFIEGYEHFILFNPYTLGGALIYDSFLGLSVSKFEISVSKKVTPTSRPTLGGYYIKGHEFLRNFEGAASDLVNLYDTHSGSDDPITNQQARALVGYGGTVNYLDSQQLNPQSQFMFHKGMLHSKGSVASILAYVNSRKFAGAEVDEFWAVKVAEFGDSRPRVYPEILLKDLDNIVDDVRFEFLGIDEDPSAPDVVYDVNSKGFKLISYADDSRWNNFPNQISELEQPLFLDGEISSQSRIFVSSLYPPRIQNSVFDYWYNPTADELRTWDGVGWGTVVFDKIHKTSEKIYWKHSEPCDDVRVVRRSSMLLSDTVSVLWSTSSTNILEPPNAFAVPRDITSKMFDDNISVVVSGSSANNGTFTVQNLIYDRFRNVTYIAVYETLPTGSVDGTLTFDYYDFGVYTTTQYEEAPIGAETYNITNAEAINIDVGEFRDIIHIYTIRPSFNSINPAKLVAKKTNSVINQVTLWHPAFGWNYYIAAYNITSYNTQDPATYSRSIQDSYIAGHFWNFAEVGTTWVDSSHLGYVPYYDSVIYPDINDRLGNWGRLAPYAEVKVYQWVRSTVPPSEWSALALSQQADITIPKSSKVSGTPRTTTFKRTREVGTGVIQFGSPTTLTSTSRLVANGQQVFLKSDSSLPTELVDSAKFIVDQASDTIPQTFSLLDVDTSEIVEVDAPIIHIDVVNLGSGEYPVESLQIGIDQLVVGDKITLSTIVGGRLPKGSANTPTISTGYQEIIFSNAKTLTDPTGLDSISTFAANVYIDGVPISVSISGSSNQVIGDLITNINVELGGSAVATLIDGGINISVGESHTISIVDVDLVNSLLDFEFINVIGATNTIYSITNISAGQNTNTQAFNLLTSDNKTITINQEGSGQLTAVNIIKNVGIIPEFNDESWTKQVFAQHRVLGAWLMPSSTPIFEPAITWSTSATIYSWGVGDEVDLYHNGVFFAAGVVDINQTTISVDTVGTNLIILSSDYIDVVRPVHTVTEPEADFDPNISDDGTTLVQWSNVFEFSQNTISIDANGANTIEYYFWVEGASIKEDGAASLSALEISNSLGYMPDPYLVVQKPKDIGFVIGKDIAPTKYKQAIIRNIAEFVNSNDQYMIQFTSDMALRDKLIREDSLGQLKDKHEEWIMIRKNQIGNIPRDLWDRATESLMGQTIIGGAPVPTLDRVVYDEKYGTTTRYGLEIGQSFVDKSLGIQTVIQYLKNPALSFSPKDINDFLVRADFNSPIGIEIAMNEIYTSFSATHVNNIWFELLHDALSTNPKFAGLMKTSWVNIHCNRVLEINGIFDD